MNTSNKKRNGVSDNLGRDQPDDREHDKTVDTSNRRRNGGSGSLRRDKPDNREHDRTVDTSNRRRNGGSGNLRRDKPDNREHDKTGARRRSDDSNPIRSDGQGKDGISLLKRNGRSEAFNRDKLERSIMAAGASIETSKKILQSIDVKNKMKTEDIRRSISNSLQKMDARSAENYDRNRRLRIRQSEDVEKGSILLDKSTMADLRLRPGDDLEIKLGNRTELFKTEISDRGGLEAFVNNRDMKTLNIDEGRRIVVQRP